MSDKEDEKKKWAFGFEIPGGIDLESIPMPTQLNELYRQSLNCRETKRELLEKALNAALENLLSWERIAHAEGFSVKVLTDTWCGNHHAVFEENKVSFVQAYGVAVLDEQEKNKEKTK